MPTIGERLRELRLSHGLTLEQVAEAASLSKAYISQMENDKANPSLGTIKAVMDVFGLPLSELFIHREDSRRAAVVRRAGRKVIALPGSGVRYELVSPDTSRKLEIFQCIAEPGLLSKPEQSAHRGEECCIILRGKVRMRVGEQEYVLEEGDSIYFDSTIPHNWENIGNTPAELISVTSPPSL